MSSVHTAAVLARRRATRGRLALIALGGACLITGLNAALVRLDVWAPVVSQRAGDQHGLIMTLGFLGTFISLERAQALGRAWAYLAPGLYGVGALMLVSPAPVLIGQLLLIEVGALFVALYLALWRRSPRPLVAAQALSAVLALGGAVVATRFDVPTALPWLIGFVVLTIASERAELAALKLGPKADRILLWMAFAMTMSIVVTLAARGVGDRLLGATLVALAGWLTVSDVVRHQIKIKGQRRFTSAALLAGYVNLIIAGGVLIVRGLFADNYSYDVAVHGVFLGFGVSMVMAHAPVILPAVLGRELPYKPVLWVSLVGLHGGLWLRFGAALLGDAWWWRAGAVVTVLSVLAFLLTSIVLVVRR